MIRFIKKILNINKIKIVFAIFTLIKMIQLSIKVIILQNKFNLLNLIGSAELENLLYRLLEMRKRI